MTALNSFYLSAFWGPRRESAANCAERAILFLEELRAIDDLFATWYLKARSHKNATAHPVILDPQYLTQQFAAGVNRRDSSKTPIEDLGFNFGAWAERSDGGSASLRVTCGCYNERVQNVCVLDVEDGHGIGADCIPQLVNAAIRAWDPRIVEVDGKRIYSR